MESTLTCEHQALVNELTQGMEKAKQLRYYLSSEDQDLFLQKIISSYEKALSILNCDGSVRQAQPDPVAPASVVPESSISVNGSSKKRKMQPTWTEQVRVNSEYGLEGPTDEYSWRKYGQKDILGAKYPRSYYRCTYRAARNCWATKQVQRSDDDPTTFEITYKGTHTCSHSINVVQSPEKQKVKQSNYQNHQLEQNQPLLNLKANLRVNTEDLKEKETPTNFSFPSTSACHNKESHYFQVSGVGDDIHMRSYSPLFYSPATSESNYFSEPIHQMTNYGENLTSQHSEIDIAQIISAHASTSNSPAGGMEFPIDPVDLDPNFPFNILGFFT